MIKFKSEEDKLLFLTENNIESLDSLDEDRLHTILRRRSKIIKILKDRRRSKIQKANWRKYKWKYLSAIRRWHRSVKGKRFHRLLGRFLSLRYFRPGPGRLKLSREQYLDLAKSISSLRTHYYIELGYYGSIDEEVSLHLLVEELLPLLIEVEERLLIGKELDDEDWDLIRFISGYEADNEELDKLVEYYRNNIGDEGKLADMVESIYNGEYVRDSDIILRLAQNWDKITNALSRE